MEERDTLIPRDESFWIPVSTRLFSDVAMTNHSNRNMFFLYGVQGPTAFSNGPTCVEVQGDWIVDAIKKLRDEKIDYIDATHEAEKEWREEIIKLSDKTLFPQTKSWYMGDNIPGKIREQLSFAGGFPLYSKMIRSVLDDGLRGYVTA